MTFLALFIIFLFIIFFVMEHDLQPKQKTSPKDFFLHLLSMLTLYVSAISFGTILFQLVNLQYPDPLNSYMVTSARDILRQGISSVIIFFPVYIGSVVYLNKMYTQHAEKRNLRIRKWLIYFTLFVASVIILFSLSSLVKHLLDGELTMSFFLKLLSVVFISASVLGFYGNEIKKDKSE